jgi:S-adenosylmethionine decarboxylase
MGTQQPDRRTEAPPTDLPPTPRWARFTPNRIGTQFVIDVRGVRADTLRDADAMDRLTHDLAAACGAKVLQFCSHAFEPTGGLTALAILSSSHVAVHTWPEFGYLAVDLFCCSTDVDGRAIEAVLAGLDGDRDGVTVTSSGFARPLVPAHHGGNN